MARASALRRLAAPGWRAFARDLTGYQRNVYLLLLFTLGKGLQISVGSVVTNLYVYSLGYRQDFIGVVAAAPAVGSLIVAVPVGILADRVGRKPLLLISGVLNPLALLGIGLSTAPAPLLLFSLLNGMLASVYWVTNIPLLTESTQPDQRVGALALNNLLLLGFGATGSLLGGAVPEAVGALLHVPALSPVPLRWGMVVAAVAVALPVLPLVWLREARHVYAAPPPAPADQPPAEAANAAPEPRGAVVRLFVRLLLPDLLITLGEGAALGLLQLYFVLRFAIQPGALGLLLMLAGLTGGITSLAAPHIVRRWQKLPMATTMQLLSVPTVLLIGFAPVLPLAAAAEFGRNILRGLFEPVYAAFAMERVSPRHRATLSGFYSVTWSLGFGLGAGIAGWLQATVSLSAAFVVSALALAAGATCLRLFFGDGTRA